MIKVRMPRLARAGLCIGFLIAAPGFAELSEALPAGDYTSGSEIFNEEDFPLIYGDGLTVVRKAQVTEDARVLNEQEIREIKAADLGELLEKGLCIAITRNGGYGMVSTPNLRGFGSGRVAVLVNGIPVNSAQNGSFDLSSINPAAVRKIEVSRGGTDSRFTASGAIGGTVNIITGTGNDPAAPDGSIGFRAGASNTAQLPAGETEDYADTQNINVAVNGKSGRLEWSADAFANKAGNHYRYADSLGRTLRLEGSEVLDAGFQGRADFRATGAARITANGSLYFADKHSAGKMNNADSGIQGDAQSRESVSASLIGFPFAAADTEATASHAWTRMDWEDGSGKSRHDLNTASFIARLAWYARETTTIHFGAELAGNVLDSTNLGSGISAIDGAVWTGGEWKPEKAFLAHPSLRLAYSAGDIVPIPKIGLAWFGDSGFTLKGNAFRVYKSPSFNDLYWSSDVWAEGNPDLKPEHGAGADAVVEYAGNSGFEAEASAHVSRLSDAVIWSPEGTKWKPMNAGDAVYWGLDARAEWKASKRFRFAGDYSYLDSRVLTDGRSFSDGKRMPYQSRHRGGGEVRAQFARWSGSVRGNWLGSRFTAIDNLTELPGVFTVDSGITVKAGNGVEFSVTGRNLGGAEYVLVEGYPLPGRTITLGVQYTYR
ncbi:TonB-dependent receptor [Treponema zuelzerae]|uniref:TonB-dependent receptor n=1 Tax=Teretinema zuelzerae TaxID=156 RepID=A0AAE3EK77_9SPIR|nr:TonB-dependent receptor plug domain-containing protein [Teretinema zuelzerae]MCD1654998.1 TonB-dependent receptor [Teretinema zuelzerae]